MALTISGLKKDVVGNKRQHFGLITFDSSYPTGGEALVPADLGLHTIERISFEQGLGFNFEYDYSAQKVKAFCPGIVIGAAGAATLDDFPLTGVGASTARSVALDNAASAGTQRFGGQVEVANTENLSTVSTRFVAIGT